MILRPGHGRGHRLALDTGKNMGIYREPYETTDDTHEWTTWSVYEQPAWRHYADVVVQAVTLRTGRLERTLDPLLERLHDLRCHDDCWTGEVSRIKPYWRTPEGKAERSAMKTLTMPTTHPEMWDTKVTTMCNRTPLGGTVDIWAYEFGQRGRRVIGKVESTKRPRDEPREKGFKISWTDHAMKRMSRR